MLRNNSIVLASKEFDLKALEQERESLEIQVEKLNQRQHINQQTLNDVRTRREQVVVENN